MAKKTAGISIPVRWDKRSLAQLMKDLEKVSQSLSGVSNHIDKTIKKSTKFAKDFRTASSALEESSDKAAKSLGVQSKVLSSRAEKAASGMSRLEKKAKSGSLSRGEQKELNRHRETLKQVNVQQQRFLKNNRNDLKLAQKTGKLKREEVKYLKEASSKVIVGKKNAILKAAGGFKGHGSLKGSAGAGAVFGGVANIGKMISNQVFGKTAGAALGLGGGGGLLGKLLPMIAQIPKFFGAALGPILAIVQLIRDASDQYAKFNKTILAGLGTVNDLSVGAEGFSNALDKVRKAAYENNTALMTIGLSAEEQLQIVNSYAKSSTGSLVQTQFAFEKMAGGQGKFVNSIYLYGKALDMEATELATTFGTLQSEAGYSAENAMSAIESTVKAAQHSGMPLGKFKMILQSVLPDVDAFTNRLDQLTGVVKMLSKSMSPETIKKFLSAFTNMFTGSDFRKRLKATLIVGPGKMGKIITEGIDKNIKAEFGEGSDIYKAFQGNDKSKFNDVLMQHAADMDLNPKQIEELMNKFTAKQLAEKGGALNVASALASGTDPMQNVQIMESMVQSLTGKEGLEGLNEHVAEQLGFSQDQVQALRRMHNAVEFLDNAVKKDGMTASQSINDALIKMAKRKQQEDPTLASKPITEVIKSFTKEERDAAYKSSEDLKDLSKTTEDRQKEIIGKTTSIDEKIGNGLQVVLEKLFNLMSGLVETINSWFSFALNSGKKGSALAKSALTSGSSVEMADINAKRADQIGRIIEGSGDIKKKSSDIASQFESGTENAERAFEGFDVKAAMARAEKAGVDLSQIEGMNLLGRQEQEDLIKGVVTAIKSGGNVAESIEWAAGNEAGLNALIAILGQNLAQLKAPKTRATALSTPTESDARKAADVIDKEMAEARKITDAAVRAARIEELTQKRAAILAEGGGTAAASGAPGSPTASPASPASVVSKSTSTQSADHVATTAESSEQTAQTVAQTQATTIAVARDIADGLKLDSSFMNGLFKQVMTASVRSGVEEPLVQHAAVMAKAMQDPDYASSLASGIGYKLGFADVARSPSDLASAILNSVPHYANGTPSVPETGLALVHKGEEINPNPGSSGASKVFNTNITVNVSGGADGNEIAAVIQQKLYDTFAGMVTA